MCPHRKMPSLSDDAVRLFAEMTSAELMILFNNNSAIASKLNDMTQKRAKRLYVLSNHALAITKVQRKDKNRDGHWTTHVYVDGKRKVVERNTEDELYEYLFEFYMKQDARFMTYDEVFEMFEEYKRCMGRSESTIREFERYNGYLSPEIRNKPLSTITETELRNWLVHDFLARGYMKEALKKMLQIIRAVFEYGIRKQICTQNPAKYILVEEYAKLCKLSAKTNEERSFSEADIEKLREYCLADKKNPHASVMLVAMETGMRAGELTALKKEDIRDGYIYVHRQQVFVPKTDSNEDSYYKYVNYTKNEREHPKGGRMIPITEKCQMALDVAFSLPGNSDYVFHHPNGNPVLKQSYMYYLRRRCKTLGIEISNNHAFRVAFNARLIEAGVDGNERCFVLGHSMQTNERHYSFSDRRKADDVMEKLKRLETQ